MGVDIARQGADQSVIRFRRGLDARSIRAVKFRIPDLMQIASRVMEQVNSHNPDAVFVDGTGIGWGVHDRLNQLGCPNLVGVDFGAWADRTEASDAAARYANKRAEMWGFLKEWLKVGSLPDDNELAADLKAVDYGYDASDAILLERKDDMRRRGLASPDDGDALALTFAYPVARRDWAEERRFDQGLQKLKRWVCESRFSAAGRGQRTDSFYRNDLSSVSFCMAGRAGAILPTLAAAYDADEPAAANAGRAIPWSARQPDAGAVGYQPRHGHRPVWDSPRLDRPCAVARALAR